MIILLAAEHLYNIFGYKKTVMKLTWQLWRFVASTLKPAESSAGILPSGGIPDNICRPKHQAVSVFSTLSGLAGFWVRWIAAHHFNLIRGQFIIWRILFNSSFFIFSPRFRLWWTLWILQVLLACWLPEAVAATATVISEKTLVHFHLSVPPDDFSALWPSFLTRFKHSALSFSILALSAAMDGMLKMGALVWLDVAAINPGPVRKASPGLSGDGMRQWNGEKCRIRSSSRYVSLIHIVQNSAWFGMSVSPVSHTPSSVKKLSRYYNFIL